MSRYRRRREGGKEGGRKGESEGGRQGGREGGEGGRKGGGREGGEREGGGEGGRFFVMEQENHKSIDSVPIQPTIANRLHLPSTRQTHISGSPPKLSQPHVPVLSNGR